MGKGSSQTLTIGSFYIISDASQSSLHLLNGAWTRIDQAFRPSTASAHCTHFRTFIAFLLFLNLPVVISTHNVLVFLEYLVKSSISPKVVKNYLSSIASMASFYRIPHQAIQSEPVKRFLRSISINSSFSPTHRGIFNIHTLYLISITCDRLSDPLLFRPIFLTAFYAFFRMSNIAPHSKKAFDPTIHILRQDLIFAPPGVHILVKWTKTLQDRRGHHMVQLPAINNMYLCPVRALRALMASRPLPPSAPLFAVAYPPHHQIIDTHIRDALKQILTHLSIPLSGHGFHTFRRSGATFCFNNNVSLQNIMAHGLWRSSAIWTYLQHSTQAASTVPLTFASKIPPTF